MFHEETVFLIGDAQVSQNNPISKKFSQFFLGVVVDTSNGRIVDAECSATIDLTVRFVRSLLVGRVIEDEDIIASIQTRYFGSSQKALIVAFRDAQRKYKQQYAALST
ncbi:DUF3870 domain-containing protein [Bacillus sp. FJAT-42376]|uniref:DUF3870 domain-containing protein n=1 Tax=Bacillus sp. FJAT-42376 TaxID=2014076 RepID=UPI000F4FB115|nr:DUF3870 domain-containing protein [Bacillus sp. FJAT-42376]AZB44979.1 DUF3870 domain-containing protein [Bacillus sp. FJAT-42376]